MTDLTDRMRTCAAYLLPVVDHIAKDGEQSFMRAVADAADLLIEASNALEGDIEEARRILHETADRTLGEPMKIIPPSVLIQDLPPKLAQLAAWEAGVAASVAKQRTANPNACPKCDSRAGKRVRREGRMLMLECPVCSERWQYKPKAEWV